jgi:lipid-A-disaccharide synthase
MRSKGFEAIIPAENMSLAGLTEVLFALPRMFRYMKQLVRLAVTRRPAVAVLIDLPDFNLRLAKRLNRCGIPVVYYISPQLWAWRQGRVEQIKKFVDQMLVILPFEKEFYDQHGVKTEFVGHPLVEELPENPNREEAKKAIGINEDAHPVVALLPGSRRKEVTRHLPLMLQSIRLLQNDFPNLRTVLPVASTIPRDLIQSFVNESGVQVDVIDGNATGALCASDAAIVCSGTSTLQTALLARPMVVVYRVSWISYWLLKRLVNVAHIALVNLIAGKRLVPELVQGAFTPSNVRDELKQFLHDTPKRRALQSELRNLRNQLGQGGTAARVTDALMPYLKEGSHG